MDAVTRECWDLDRARSAVADASQGVPATDTSGDVLRDYVLDVVMKRNKRCVMGYAWERARRLRESVGASDTAGTAPLEGITPAEQKYLAAYETLLNGVSIESELDLASSGGHDGAFVLVRNAELRSVVVEGEFSKVFLAPNGEGVLKRADAERLSKTGEVNILHGQ